MEHLFVSSVLGILGMADEHGGIVAPCPTVHENGTSPISASGAVPANLRIVKASKAIEK